MDDRETRIVKNEELFRAVNERIEEINQGIGVATVDESAEFVCECGEADCTERVRVSIVDYERIRENSHWFFVVPGHEIPDVETVVEQADGYVVVEKSAEAERHAHDADERSD